MAALFVDLEESLRLSREGLTSQEANVLKKCAGRTIKDGGIGAAIGGFVTWLATRQSRLVWQLSVPPMAVVAYFTGKWSFNRSMNSCLGDILSLDGSRMQKVLANIMVKKYGNHPSTIQFIPQHFFLEIVLSDSSIDKPILRWRSRNIFNDSQGLAHYQNTHKSGSYSNEVNSENTDVNPSPMSGRIDIFADPFDCLFGIPERKEENFQTSTPSTSARRRRAHRRRRMEEK
ncbi:hypothetical protein NMG60_11029935 [Bertholletia excelsa]